MDGEDQNFVANLIAGKKMKAEKAAEVWIKTHQKQVKAVALLTARRHARL